MLVPLEPTVNELLCSPGRGVANGVHSWRSCCPQQPASRPWVSPTTGTGPAYRPQARDVGANQAKVDRVREPQRDAAVIAVAQRVPGGPVLWAFVGRSELGNTEASSSACTGVLCGGRRHGGAGQARRLAHITEREGCVRGPAGPRQSLEAASLRARRRPSTPPVPSRTEDSAAHRSSPRSRPDRGPARTQCR